MDNLKFDNNWRRVFLLTKETDRNLDKPVTYVALDKKKLGMSVKGFCEECAYEDGFDYDPTSWLLWPRNDSISSETLVKTLNKKLGKKVASIIVQSPSDAHNLSFSQYEDDDYEDDLSLY